MKTQFSLLKSRRLWPLFAATCLGAFNDNLFKNALILSFTYTIIAQSDLEPELLSAVIAGLFILPFFLFSALAGQIADKMDKSLLIQYIKLAEVFLMFLVAVGVFTNNIALLFIVLFLMGTQSVFYGPVKYAVLPDLLAERELIGGNALLEMGLVLSVLMGTLAGLLVLAPMGPMLVSAVLIILACAGFLAARKIPGSFANEANLKINWNLPQETFSILQVASKRTVLFRSILGVSWFWFGGAIFLTLFPAYALKTLGAKGETVTLFLILFSAGIAIGALACNWILKGKITSRLTPYALIAASIFCIDLYFASPHQPSTTKELMGLPAFIMIPKNWRIMADLLGFAISFGIFMVPLSTIIQKLSPDQERSRMLAANNIMNTFCILLSAAFIGGMSSAGYSIPAMFMALGIGNSVLAIAFLLSKQQ